MEKNQIKIATDHVIHFNNTDYGIKKTVGGKAFGLIQLYNLHLNVPSGFILSTEAYDKYVEKIKMRLKIQSKNYKKENNSKKPKNGMETLIATRTIDEYTDGLSWLNGEIENAFNLLWGKGAINTKIVAIRSSCVSEDETLRSYSGIFKTYLGVKGKTSVREKVILCWASSWNSEALEYRDVEKKSFEEEFEDKRMGIIIQELIFADKAGVAFSKNPITNNESVIGIDSNYGLGESVVSGEVSPDVYFVNKKNPTDFISRKGKKEFKYVLDQDSNIVRTETTPEEKESLSLSEDEIEEIARTTLMIENKLGHPIDIEWCYSDSKLFILQARAITT